MRVTKALEYTFLACQAMCIALSLSAGEAWSHLLLTCSCFFGGAFLGAFFCGRASSGEVTHG